MGRPSDDSSSLDSTTTKSSATTIPPKAENNKAWSTTLFRTLSSFFSRNIVWQSDSKPLPPSSTPNPPPAQPPSRTRSIETTSSPISGTYDLLDNLSIRSLSGRINVNISPQPADAKTPVPAELRVSSLSGAINVYMPSANIPQRDYVTEITSKSGAVNGSLVLGRRTSVETLSGAINLHLHSLGGGSLRTSCLSGRTNLTVTGATGTMSSVHSTASGSMTLRYPREWSGTIEGSSTSGRMNLYGPGIQIVRQGPNEVVAKKGDGNSRLEFRTASGSVNVYFE